MSNPWLSVGLSEYEQHMASTEVQQLGALSDLFGAGISRCRPLSVAILGIAGGNGLDHIDTATIARIVGLDINPDYLDATRHRYAYIRGLELHCVDLCKQDLRLAPVDFVHAALIFEHAGVDRCLDNALSLVAPGGHLSVVLQLPTQDGRSAVGSKFASIRKLGCHFALVSPQWLEEALAFRGLRLIHATTRALPLGKGFWAGIFVAPEAEGSP